MSGAAVRPDPFPAMRLPGHSPDPRWWLRFFRPIRRLLFAADVPTGPYGERSTLTTSRRTSGIGSDPPDATHREKPRSGGPRQRSEEHTSELQSRRDLVCRLLLEKKKQTSKPSPPVKTKTNAPKDRW